MDKELTIDDKLIIDEEQKRAALLKKIARRWRDHYFWAKFNFIIAQLFIWLGIISSFLASILTAAGEVSKLTLTLLVAIPGIVILIDKAFSFTRRALWSIDNAAKYEQLCHQLQFEKTDIEEVSKKLAEIQLDMVANFPTISTDVLNNKPPTNGK